MSPEEEAQLRQSIQRWQFTAARHERKGVNMDGAHDPRWFFDQATEASEVVESLQDKLTAAGLAREPDRRYWDFT